jgi:hypothetical protein
MEGAMKSGHVPIERWIAVGIVLSLVVLTVGATFAAVPRGENRRPVAVLQDPAEPITPPVQAPLPRKVASDLAQGVFHFPLHNGNEWIYEKRDLAGNETSWKVVATGRNPGDGAGFVLNGYFGDGRVVAYGEGGEVTELASGGPDLVWYRLGTSKGTSWKLGFVQAPLGCLDGSEAVLAAHDEQVNVPAGEFINAIRVDYKSPCGDLGGLVSEWFAENVGLVKRLENTAWGPVVSTLLSAKVGDLVLPDHAGATSLTHDAEVYHVTGSGTVAPKLQGAFRVNNRTSDIETWDFMGCVSATWALVEENTGVTVLEGRVDDGGNCGPAEPPPSGDVAGGDDGGPVPIDTLPGDWGGGIMTVSIRGESLVLPIDLVLAYPNGTPLPTGHYYLKMTLDALEHPNGRPSASAHIQVVSTP